MGQVDGAKEEQHAPLQEKEQHMSRKEQSDELKRTQNDNSAKQQREQQEQRVQNDKQGQQEQQIQDDEQMQDGEPIQNDKQGQDREKAQDEEQAQNNTQQKDGGNQKQPFCFNLPDRVKSWKSSPLKDPSTWDSCLQALCNNISHFDYPAAIFWGHELVLLYNQAWIETGGIREQGDSQRGSLSADAWNALSRCITGGRPSRIASHALLRETEKPAKDHYTVLASPLFSTDPSQPQGVIAQMIRIPPGLSSPKAKGQEVATKANRTMGDSRLDSSLQSARDPQRNHTLDSLGMEPSDNTPLDEHPFFHRFAEMLPTGLAILDHRAQAVFVNQHFYQLTTHMSDDKSFRSWPQSIHPDDYERVMGAYQDAFNSQTQLRTEFRALGSEHPWRLLLLTPLGDENLKHVSLGEYGGFICSVVDITSEKSAEISQRMNAEEATERKRQQERFIDMVSHEIRNPLSAMVHCVEDIHDAITTTNGDKSLIDLAQIREALETVDLCISHQKNIVDDVLSFSKLDSSMLALSPSPCKPESYLRKSLNMFSPQFRKHNIAWDYRVDPPYRDLDVDWTMADLSRIGQVLINLITNAIKFTSRKEGEKRITVKVSAAQEQPGSYPPEIVFFDETREGKTTASGFKLDATERPEWGTGEPFYVMVALMDTGIGISEEGQSKLFERFKQATPKTGEIYGGSGLGLNISRKLVQLHGGEIGVASTEGKGATFGFYFRVRRSQGPKAGENGGASPDVEGVAVQDQGREQAGDAASDAREGETREQNKEDEEKAKPGEGSQPQPPDASRKNESREEGEERQVEMKEAGEKLQHTAMPSGGSQERQHVGRGVSYHDRKGRDQDSAQGKGGDKSEANQVGDKGRAAAQPDAASGNTAPKQQQSNDLPTRPNNADKPQSKRRLRPNEVLHVLLVEDNVINQRIVARKLGAKPYYRVSVASNGQEAVDIVKASLSSADAQGSQVVDVVLMDQEMPVMDGNAAAKAIRSLEHERGEGGRVPILGVSANVRQEQLTAMMDCGMDGYITKPYRIEEMVGRIGELLGIDFEGSEGERDGMAREGGAKQRGREGADKVEGKDGKELAAEVNGGESASKSEVADAVKGKNGKELAAEVNGSTDTGEQERESGDTGEKADQGSWAEKSARRSRERKRAKRVDEGAGGG